MSRYAKLGRCSPRVGEVSSKYAYDSGQLDLDVQIRQKRIEAARDSFTTALAAWEKENTKLSREQRKDVISEILVEKYRREGLI